MNVRIRSLSVKISVLWLILFFAFGIAMAQSPGATASKRKEEAAKKGLIYLTRAEIMDGAKKEAKLVVAPGYDEETRPRIVEAFQKVYPFIKEVDWRIVQGNDGEQRQLLEMKTGRANVDVMSPHQAYYSEYRKFNPFKNYDLRAMAQDGQLRIHPEMIDDSGLVVWLGSGTGVLLYNSKIVAKDKIPTGWESCLEPQWKGKFSVDTKPVTLVRLIPRWGEEKLMDYARKLKANDPIWSQGSVAPRLAAGEFSLMCGALLHSTKRLLKKDPTLPIGIVIPDPLGIGLTEPEAVYATARNPNGSLLWLEFLASAEGQRVVEEVNPGKGSLLIEGTIAHKLAQGANVSLCGPGCFDRIDQLMRRIAVEAWGFPKAGK